MRASAAHLAEFHARRERNDRNTLAALRHLAAVYDLHAAPHLPAATDKRMRRLLVSAVEEFERRAA